MKSLTKQTRLTGVMYLAVIVCAGFSQGYVRANLYIPGDAVATATNLLENTGLFRLGLVADLVAFIIDAVISVMFYQILKPYGKTLALVSSSLRLLAHPAIGAINLLNHYMALDVLTGMEMMTGFQVIEIQTLSLWFMNAHRYGYLIAGGFFGVHCLLLGVQLSKSKLVPVFIGVFMMVAGVGYLMETFGDFLFPGNEGWLAWVVGLSAALGEVELALYLIIKGVKKSDQLTEEV